MSKMLKIVWNASITAAVLVCCVAIAYAGISDISNVPVSTVNSRG